MKSNGDVKSLFRVKYHKKVIEFVCSRIANGMTMTKICRDFFGKSPLIPEHTRTIHRWIAQYPEFKEKYQEAMRVKYLTLHDHIIDLTDEEPADTGDFKRDQTMSRHKETKIRTLLALSGQLASKYVPELKDQKQDLTLSAPVIKILNYYQQAELPTPAATFSIEDEKGEVE